MRLAYTVFALAGLVLTAPLIAAMARAQSKSLRSSETVAHAPKLPFPSRSPSLPSLPADCPDEMVLVDGAFCPRVEQRCLRWMDPPGKYHRYRCAEYARPASCLAPRVHKRFCVDRRERIDLPTGLPLNAKSWTDAKQACEDAGARVCMDSEWTFACEGEEMRPYPYGWSRTLGACNADRTDLLAAGQPERLRDEREPAHASCASPFGILDMAGNVAEWVSVDGFPQGSVVVQKGNWWQPGKHACRDEQAGHDRFYKGTETGFRCCATAR
jgi:sulfatase modifying factor 1